MLAYKDIKRCIYTSLICICIERHVYMAIVAIYNYMYTMYESEKCIQGCVSIQMHGKLVYAISR